MIDLKAFYKISYGLYIVSSGDSSKNGGYISNSVFQVTSEPAKFAICCNKNNFTASLIQRSSVFAVSVLHRDSSPEIIGRFGFRSGKDTDKLAGLSLKFGETGVPVVLSECIAWFECRVDQTVDAGTHLIFIGQLLNSGILDDQKEPMTYSYYREARKGFAPKNAPTYIDPARLAKNAPLNRKFRCPVCGYIYDEEVEGKPFAELPGDWICPVCGTEKSEFVEI